MLRAAAAERLGDVAETLAREDLAAEAALLAGRVAAARGDSATADRELEEAVARFAALRFPLEEARARLALASVQAARGSPLALVFRARCARRLRAPRRTPGRRSGRRAAARAGRRRAARPSAANATS